MGEFFKTWRRKIGVVTLVMACVFMSGWIRGFGINDQIVVTLGEPSNVFASTGGYLRWTRYYGLSEPPFKWQSSKAGAMFGVGEPIDNAPIQWQWRWQWCGFDFGKGRLHGQFPMAVSAIPYWFIVASTALLSAFLLLSKPRRAMQPITAASEQAQPEA